MAAVTLVFPHQLFLSNPALHIQRVVWLVEEELFFTQYNFHSIKLQFQRESMLQTAKALVEKGYTVKRSGPVRIASFIEALYREGVTDIHLCDPVDYLLERRLHRASHRCGMQVHMSETPNFICTNNYIDDYFSGRKRFFMNDFYIDQRKRLGILLENGQPLGGKWSFDTENRKRMPKSTVLPPRPVSGPLLYATTHAEADKRLNSFLEQRFRQFGEYQDAIVEQEPFLFHSVIAPYINSGLLDPGDVVQRSIDAATEFNVPLNALEGFVRQIIGWREYIRAVYRLRGTEQCTRNFWNHQHALPRSFYEGTTGIPPVDAAIRHVQQYAYTHHIERLMVLGNFMLLCRIHPDAVYQWFMELFIDSYDWVMVPNVYGMSQFADGGLMCTKPYISGSNYILKMSHYEKGSWCETWDAIYWKFVHDHRDFFLRNPRMSMMVHLLDKMESERRRKLFEVADRYLSTFTAFDK